MKRTISLLLACLMILGMLAACSPVETSPSVSETFTEASDDGTPKQGGTLIVGLPGDPSSYNPNLARDEASGIVVEQIFNSLVLMDSDQNIVADLAESWEYNEDATELTFHLREGVKWHDGEPCTSADVKWTFDTVVSKSGTLSANLSNLTEITAPDDYTVVFKLSTSDFTLVSSLAWYGGFIMPKHIYEGTDWTTNPANQSPIGTGPFKFVSAQTGVQVELEANTDYFGEGPYLDRLVFQVVPDAETEYQMWQNGEIDVMYNALSGADFNKYDNDPDYSVRFNLLANRVYFTFNFAKEDNPLQDVRLREAFNYALNREQILTTGLKGNGAVAEYYTTPVFDWALNKDVTLPEQNIAKAKELLEDAGYTADTDGIYLSVTVDTFEFYDTLVVAQANLKEAGIDLQINTMEQVAWMEKVFGGNFDLTILAGDQGPDISSIGNRVGTGGSMNVGLYSNERIDELLALGAATSDQDGRAGCYQEIQSIMAEELPMIICNEYGMKVVVRSDVHGIPLVDDAARSKVRNSCFGLAWLE